MPPQELAFRRQRAVLWEATGATTRSGRPAVSDVPVDLRVRWDPSRRELPDGQGGTVVVDATVIVDRAVPEGSLLWLGETTTLPGDGAFPGTNPLMVVVSLSETVDIKGRVTYRELLLQRYGSRLPT